MRYASPLRYPGGKAGLSNFLASVIELNELEDCLYFEPYAGGAGAALGLLQEGFVSEIYLNDADRRVYSFWRSAISSSQEFVDRILDIPLSIKEWRRQREICRHPKLHRQFDLGFAAFYMNRCNRSGVLTAGPIGGYGQHGEWRIGVRFNREAMSERILGLARMKDQIHLSCKDAIAFLKKKLPKGSLRNKVFVYLDPPYVSNGSRLYLNAYERKDHAQLSRYLKSQKSLHWIMSYDDSELIRTLYSDHKLFHMPIGYSLQEKRSAQELIIAPNRISVPKACRVRGHESLLLPPK